MDTRVQSLNVTTYLLTYLLKVYLVTRSCLLALMQACVDMSVCRCLCRWSMAVDVDRPCILGH